MKNEKKFYVQPECEVLQLCVEAAILNSSPELPTSAAPSVDKVIWNQVNE